jgi:uncharacterized protein YdaU (DUF1376 family)
MSGKPSHIPLFPDAYLRDNYRLTLEQHGLFLMLMMEAWNSDDCTLPDDAKALADIVGIPTKKFAAIAGPVLSRWTREGGRIYQKRLLKEWHWVKEKSAKARAAVAQRADRNAYERTTNEGTNDLHLGGGGGGGGGEKTLPGGNSFLREVTR